MSELPCPAPHLGWIRAARGLAVVAVALAALACQSNAEPAVQPAVQPAAPAGPASPSQGSAGAASGRMDAPSGTTGSPYGGRLPGTHLVSGPLATSEPRADLKAYCADIANHVFIGTAKLKSIEGFIGQFGSSAPNAQALGQLIQAQIELGFERLRQADPAERVLPEFERAFQLANANRAAPESLAQLAYFRGVAKLRLGEISNCSTSHNPYQCILDAGQDGAFSDRASVESAMADFSQTLSVAPQHIGARWLLNISAMLLGEYPDAVPEAWRIPPERFASAHAAPRFRNIAYDLGVAAVSQAGSSYLEDVDNDGLLDMVTTTLNPCMGAKLFHNDGNGSFSDRSEASGLAEQLGAFGGQQTDYNNDGFVDLFFTRGGWQNDSGRMRRSLMKNNGDGTFTDVSMASGLAGPAYPTQASAWADYDNDGDLDVYVGNEVTNDGAIYPSQLYRNNGDGTFTNVAEAAGVTNDRMAKGVAWGDYDNDRDPDLYVSNLGLNRFYKNNGDGTFTDVAPELQLTEPSGRSFSTWFFDYNNDGWLDIFVANYEALLDTVAASYMGQPVPPNLYPRLYRNNHLGGFDDVTAQVHLDRANLVMGSNFGDIDNDGFPDLYLATGDPSFWTVLPDVLYWNDHGQGFVDVTQASGTGYFPKGHGVSFGDLDNDGDQDLAVQSGGFYLGDAQPDALFENPGAGNHWVTLKLVGETSNKAAIGARISLTVTEGAADRLIHQEVTTGSSFGANSLQQEIGLGQARVIKTLVVDWPTSGSRQVFTNVAADRFYEVREGAKAPKAQDRPKIRFEHMAMPGKP